jgi:hypothetical protein
MSGTAPQGAGAGPSGGSYVPAQQAGGAPVGGAGGNPPQPQPAPPSAQNLNQIVSFVYFLLMSDVSLLVSATALYGIFVVGWFTVSLVSVEMACGSFE